MWSTISGSQTFSDTPPMEEEESPPPIAPSTCALFYIQLLSQNVQSHLTKIKNDESSICAKTKQQQLATKPAVWPKHLNICNLNNNEVYIGQQNKNKCRHLERSMMIIFLLETAQKQVVGLRSLYSNYTCGCNEPVFHFRAEVSSRYCIEGISHTVILGTAVWEVFLGETSQWGYVLPKTPNHCCGVQIIHFSECT